MHNQYESTFEAHTGESNHLQALESVARRGFNGI